MPESAADAGPLVITDESANFPLTDWQVVLRTASQVIPVFATGTDIEQVRRVLLDRNNTILREWPGHLVAQANAGLFTGKFLYGFENGALVLGPVTLYEAESRLVAQGLDAEDVETLRLFASTEPADPDLYNEFAWFLSRYPEVGLWNPTLAIEYATRANELSDWADPDFLGTLAAAYASVGDFQTAVEYQRQAIATNSVADSRMRERLRLYLDGKPYTVPLSELVVPEPEPEHPSPNPELVRKAEAGSADAQWNLAVFYIENHIAANGGLVDPGVFWLRKAAAGGHPYAANELGNCFLLARCGVPFNPVEALRWFKAAAESGDLLGDYHLGLLLAEGVGTERDEVEATRLLTQAADAGFSAAAFTVAFRYGQGLGTAKDVQRKSEYLQQAASDEYGPAEHIFHDPFLRNIDLSMSVIGGYLDRLGTGPDEMAEALMDIARFIEAASTTSDDMEMVEFQDGTTLSIPRGQKRLLIFHLTRVAASAGSNAAQLELAEYYEKGHVVHRSLPQAEYWRQRAAR